MSTVTNVQSQHSEASKVAYVNGRFLPQAELAVSVADAGFVAGATITDLCRTFRHRLFRLDDHFRRFRQSCELAHIPLPPPDDELRAIADELILRNSRGLPREEDLALVMLRTPGPLSQYGFPETGPTLILHTFGLPFARYRPYHERGVHLVVPPGQAVPPRVIDPRIKHRSRLAWWILEAQARAIDPNATALPVDDDGHIGETATANVLIVRNGGVVTPPRPGVLDGVSLRVVEEFCRELNIPFEEQPLTVRDIQQASEAMLSCTSFCLAGISRVDGVPVPWPGPIFERLLKRWSGQVGVDIRRQILANR